MGWTAPKTWAVGDPATAADFNTYIRDNGAYLFGDTAWTTPTFANGWVNNGANIPTAGYRRFGPEIVFQGIITTGTMGQPAFTLPVGMRPPGTIAFAVASNAAFGEVVINATGTVVPTAGSNLSFGLNGVFFSTF